MSDGPPPVTPLEFCVHCGRIVVVAKPPPRRTVWLHWGTALEACDDDPLSSRAAPGGNRLTAIGHAWRLTYPGTPLPPVLAANIPS